MTRLSHSCGKVMSKSPLLLWSAPPCCLWPHSDPVGLGIPVGRLASYLLAVSTSLRFHPVQSHILSDVISLHLSCRSDRTTSRNKWKTVQSSNWVATLWRSLVPHTLWSHRWGELRPDQEWLTGSSRVTWTMWSSTCAVLACLDWHPCWGWTIPIGCASWYCPSVLTLQWQRGIRQCCWYQLVMVSDWYSWSLGPNE